MTDSTDRRQAPPALDVHAADNLRFIRDTMARATSFTAVPGWGGVFIGVTALAVAAVAGPPDNTPRWIGLWLAEAALAIGIGLVASIRKGRRFGVSFSSPPVRRFLLVFVPGLVAGAVLTAMFVHDGWTARLPACWLLLYGASVASAGAFSVKPVPVMGASFMALGVLAALIPVRGGDALLAAGFGLLHIAFGVIIARNHGG